MKLVWCKTLPGDRPGLNPFFGLPTNIGCSFKEYAWVWMGQPADVV